LLLRGTGERWIDFLQILPRDTERRASTLGRLRTAVDQQWRLANETHDESIVAKWSWVRDYVAEYEHA
jgi:hypothetical protein